MAIIKSIFNTFILLLTIVQLSQCLYEDQIGSFDWKKTFIGRLRFAGFDSVKRVVIATEENALASINLKNGQIVWRQLLESPETHRIEFLQVDTEVLTVSGGNNTYYIRTWDLNAGTLLSEWSLTTERSNSRWIVSKNQLIHLIPVVNSHLEVTLYDLKTGLNKGTTSRISTPWVVDLSNCAIANTVWACLSSTSSNANLYFIDLAGDLSKVRNNLLSNFIGDVSGTVQIHEIQHSEPAVLIRRNDVHRLVVLGAELKTLPYSLESSVISVTNGDQNLLMQFEYDVKTQAMQLKGMDIDTNENTVTALELKSEVHPKMVTGICRGANCRVLFTTNDDTIGLLQLPSGKVQWQREEALSNVLVAEFVELPLSELEASIEREFTEAASDIVSMFIKRITSQMRQVSTYFDGTQASSNSGLVRDVFGLHKLIILATRVGKLYAIDTITGEIVWSHHLAGIEPFHSLSASGLMYVLHQQRTARYAPHSAQMTLIGKLPGSDRAVLYSFDPITGKTLQEQTQLKYKLKQAMLLPYEDKTHLKSIVLLADNDELHVYPPIGREMVVKHAASTFMFNADFDKSILQGYALHYSDENTLRATRTWQLNLSGSTLTAIAVRPANERVHSQGRVLADRSVFYKYVNPNLIAVATVAPDVMHRHVLSVYLVDGVTGLITYSAHHKRANGPVQMVHSENWLVYSYFSERYRRYEVTSVELYEGARQSNSTHFSSHALSQLPHPETLSYILPINPVTMLATQTERGITNKHILIGMSSGAVLEMPWAFLEPRGPHMPSNPEEGTIPYMPELPVQTENMINYNQTLGRITGIQVSPAKLESTSLVVVWGMDLFYTRVTPSKSFDVLKEDFDHWLIVMVLAALTLASYVSKKLSRRKALKQMWK
ncbi:LOW QUALITY PROTEIN: ER membrane protein complex subunit 1-like [Atheta coriaria]|uniref:LOW QUALITY PROTEIN: ER membrane protein complex subunit 1-like n=1 Tax=Dalotia coriaria TaxID=877792 RepID=UPI0031F34C90